MRQIYTTGEIARLFQVAPRTAGKWIDTGLLAGYRIPGRTSKAGDRRATRAAVVAFAKKYGIPLEQLEDDGPDDDPTRPFPPAEAALGVYDDAA